MHNTYGLSNAKTQVLNVYVCCGVNPQLALMKGEFEKLKAKLEDKVKINTTGKT